MNPKSTSQILAQQAQANRAQAEEALLAQAPQYQPVRAGNSEGLMTAGTNLLMQAISAPEQRRTAQANADRANAIRLEQQAYDRQNYADETTYKHAQDDIVNNRLQESSTRTNRNLDQDYRIKQNTELLKQGQTATAQKGEDLINSILTPTRKVKQDNIALFQEAQKTGQLTLVTDPLTGKTTYAPISPEYQQVADDYNTRMQSLDTVGDPTAMAKQFRDLAYELNHDKDKFNDMSPEQEAQFISQLNNRLGQLGSLNTNQEAKWKGQEAQLDEQFETQYKQVMGNLDIAQKTLATDMDHLDKRAAEEGAPTDFGADEFIKANNFDADDSRYIKEQVKNAVREVQGNFNQVAKSGRGHTKQGTSKFKWHDEYVQLAVQNVLKKQTTRSGESGIDFDWGNNDLNKTKFKEALKAEMQRISAFYDKHKQLKDMREKHEKTKAVKRLRYLAANGITG